ncbi:uncharacterized protein DS421_19g654620 [Arachis hypogaea]|uniref:Uncharacterized protein n=1 Tax=Arachis hypogaea TaxID=3818 RepID=A0A6B9VBS8_ARAHY|nr:uncharacterized protein DS421_19g654620 [Arachis hypogaea]
MSFLILPFIMRLKELRFYALVRIAIIVLGEIERMFTSIYFVMGLIRDTISGYFMENVDLQNLLRMMDLKYKITWINCWKRLS